jgi:paraquat-inducible protein A
MKKKHKRLSGKLRGTCFASLVIALVCNISVLFVPFLVFRKLLKPETYTFFHSVQMLWDEGIYALAILVIGFSLVFPFFKLLILFWVVSVSQPGPRLLGLLNRVEILAKWSMLDVFLVCLVLTLTSGQVLVSATPKEGVPLFIAAIVISMVVGQVLAKHLLEHSSRKRPSRWLKMELTPRWRVILVGISGLLLLGALALPFLKISSWFLIDDSFSILTVLPALWSQGSYPAVFAVGLFLVLFPVLRWTALAKSNWDHAQGCAQVDYERTFKLARFWSMLDVFALALGVFLIEGNRFVPSDAEFGALLLIIVVFVNVLVENSLEVNSETNEALSSSKAV